MRIRSRSDRIAQRLQQLEDAGITGGWYCYSPGDWRGRRWVVGSRAYSTAEVEAFIEGAELVRHHQEAWDQ